ncbi:MAG: hypothetical protein JEZ07_12995 [Phycisphaerae bacterium]|nr:hypothetical protein [Phycisphaerae bacterium]
MASLKKRGKSYYIQYYQGGKQKRSNLHTSSLQLAKEKLRQFESTQLPGRVWLWCWIGTLSRSGQLRRLLMSFFFNPFWSWVLF